MGMALSLTLTKGSSLKCKFKAHVQPKHKAVSSVAKRMYDCIVPSAVTLHIKFFVTLAI